MSAFHGVCCNNNDGKMVMLTPYYICFLTNDDILNFPIANLGVAFQPSICSYNHVSYMYPKPTTNIAKVKKINVSKSITIKETGGFHNNAFN